MIVNGSPTYDDIQDWSSITQSAGIISGGVISDATGGNINVTGGCGIAKTSNSEIGVSIFTDWVARNGIAIAQDVKHTVYVDYDASPQIKVTTDPNTDIDYTTKFLIGSVLYDGTTMHILNEAGTRIYNLARRVHKRARKLRGFERATGLVTGDEGTRYFSVTSGTIYAGLNELSITGINTVAPTSDNYISWYYDGNLGGGTWVEDTTNTQLDNVQYNAIATGLANLTSNRYGVHWIFMDVDNHCNVVYGQGNYTLSDAQDSIVPASLPTLLSSFAILIARIIVQEGAAEIIEVASAFDTIFQTSTVSDHGELAGLADNDHTQYILHSLADAENDFLVASGANAYVKKTLAETGAILETDLDHGNLQGLSTGADHSYIDQDVTSGANVTFGTIGSGTITSTGDLIIRDLGYIGSVSDVDAIQIEADGDVVLTQDLTLNSGNLLLNGGILYTDDIQEDDTGVGVTVDGVLIKDIRIQEIDAIHRSAQDDYLTIAGGNAVNDGASIDLYGSTHATAASDIYFSAGGVAKLYFDASVPSWYTDQPISTTSNIRLNGGVLYTDDIQEDDSNQGVTVDGVLIKDSSLVIGDGSTIGSASDTDVMTIDASGNTTFSVFPITPSAAPDADYEVANKKYVDDQLTAEDLDTAGDTGTGAVDLDSQSLTVAGGSGITTIAADQSITAALDINSLDAATIVSGDFVPFWDITATATNKKTTFANFEAVIDHGNLQGLDTGADHSYIDQDVTNASTPTFTGTNITGVPAASVLAGTLGTGAYVFDNEISGITDATIAGSLKHTGDTNTHIAFTSDVITLTYGGIAVTAANITTNNAKISADGSINTHSNVDIETDPVAKNDVLMYNGSNFVPVVEGTTFTFSCTAFDDGLTTGILAGSGEWQGAGAITYSATYDNGPPTTSDVKKSINGAAYATMGVMDGPAYTSGDNTDAVNYPTVDQYIRFRLDSDDGTDSDIDYAASLYFYNYIYYGSSTTGSGFDEAAVEALTGTISPSYTSSRSINAGASNYVVWAYPSRYTSIHASGARFNSITMPFTSPETVELTNTAGLAEDYKVFASTLTNLGNSTLTLSTSANLIDPLYYGKTVKTDTFLEADVEGLATNEITNDNTQTWDSVTTGAGEYMLFAFPTRLGTPTFWVGGFEGGFESPETVSVTNVNGYAEDYYVWRSTNLNLGDTIVETK